jgi:hypothetical protein
VFFVFYDINRIVVVRASCVVVVVV